MPRRPCLICGEAIAPGPCPHCGTRPRNGSTRAWRTVRATVLARDHHRCTRCGTTEQLEVHHLVPVAEGGTVDLDRLTVLCSPCHHAQH